MILILENKKFQPSIEMKGIKNHNIATGIIHFKGNINRSNVLSEHSEPIKKKSTPSVDNILQSTGIQHHVKNNKAINDKTFTRLIHSMTGEHTTNTINEATYHR